MSSIDNDHYATIDDVRKITPVSDAEVQDGTVDGLIISQSKYMVSITNREWTQADFLFETIQNMVARLVAVQILQRRGKFQDAQILKEAIDGDIKTLLKSPYLHATDAGEGKKSAVITVQKRSSNWYKERTGNTRYRSNWAKSSSKVSTELGMGEFSPE